MPLGLLKASVPHRISGPQHFVRPRPEALLLVLPLFLLAVLFLCGALAAAGPVGEEAGPAPGNRQPENARVFQDVLGHQLEWREPPGRIVSLSPSLTEILFAIGCDTTVVVGVTRFCNFPPAVENLPSVGGVADPSLEAVLMLAPHLVLATRGNPLEFMESLVSLGIPVYAVETQGDLSRILQTILEVGRVAGRPEAAQGLVDSLSERLDNVIRRTDRLGPDARPRVYMGELDGAHWTAGPGSFVHALIAAAGGDNVGSVAPAAWSPLSLEVIIARDPEVYLGTFERSGEDAARRKVLEALRTHEGWRHTTIARDPRVFLVHEDRLQRPGPRVFDVLEEFARFLHPRLWSEDHRRPQGGRIRP